MRTPSISLTSRISSAILLLTAIACGPVTGSDPDTKTIGKQLTEPAKVWTRLHTTDTPQLLRELYTESIDITGSSHRLGYVDIYTTESMRDDIVRRYARYLDRSAELEIPAIGRGLSDYHDPDEIADFLLQTENQYPNIAMRVVLEDDLYESGVVYAMKISDNVEANEGEPTYMMDGQMHAREVMTSEVCIDAIEYLTTRYGSDPAVTRWVDEMEIWIVPVVNPDGANYVHSYNSMWRTNRKPGCGVDLNRNYAWSYRECQGSSGYCGDETYHGTGPASEPEIQAMQNLMAEVRPMYYINYHSYGEYILWPGGCGNMEDNERQLLSLVGEELDDRIEDDYGNLGGYTAGCGAYVMYPAPGGTEDQAYGAYGAVAFTFELNSGSFQPSYSYYRDVTVERQRAGWQYLLDRTLDGPSVRGRVYDSRTGQPVVATYEFENHRFTSGQDPLSTDPYGRFGRAVLPNSTHEIRFSAPDYRDYTVTVNVGNGPNEMEVAMLPDAECFGAADCIMPHVLTPTCTDNLCVIVTCEAGWGDCNGNTQDGCERDTRNDIENCGSCGKMCSFPNAQAICQSGGCIMGACQTLFSDCNSSPVDGCESQVGNDPMNCGSCGFVCQAPNASSICQSGNCLLGSCDHLWGDCDSIPTNGCESDLSSNPNTCGSCQNVCQLPNAVAGCSQGSCVPVMCNSGFADCNLAPQDGCEVSLLNSLQHCGACGQLCQLPGASSTCQQGMCILQSCLPGMGDCNFSPTDGCEADLQSSRENCGACGQACEFPNAQSACSNGQCLLTGCNPGYSDCNLLSADGCEANTLSDVNNCGNCGIMCPPDHACNQGTCQFCLDNDGDSFKDAACGGEDCDDTNPDIRPGTLEDCDGIDQNCNGLIDEGAECVIIGSCGCSASAGDSGEFAILAMILIGFMFGRRRAGDRQLPNA